MEYNAHCMLKYIPSVGKIIRNTISNQKQAILNDFKSKPSLTA